jgi:uncharacterized membrane protein
LKNVTGDISATVSNGTFTITGESDTYGVTISQPDDKTTTEGVNATYVLTVTNTGNTADTYTLSCDNSDFASTASLDKATMTLAAGASEDVKLNVTNTAAGTFNVTVTAASADATATTESHSRVTTSIPQAQQRWIRQRWHLLQEHQRMLI